MPYPEDKKIPETTPFDPYFPTCPVNDLQNEPALDDLSQIDHSEIAVHTNGNSTSTSTVDLPTLIIRDADDQKLNSPHTPERPNKVRFQSRVRITSGLNRHRHKSQHQSGIDYLSFSPASSVSGSPSSSISVPLRTHTDDEVGKPGWGTLGQRVSLFARGNMERKKNREQRERPTLGGSFRKGVDHGGEAPVIPYVGTDEINEETPLLWGPRSRHRDPISNGNDHEHSCSAREDEASQSREIEMVFGSWPGRLANYHWWWWQVEPIICCRILSDSYDEA